uniref:Uncharacterized protein n=1 Tax=Glossina austeni TaxID=7395 RepID=A0A1A9VII1_GLOAU
MHKYTIPLYFKYKEYFISKEIKDWHPLNAKVSSKSFLSTASIPLTPVSPSQAKPHRAGRPTKTILAPKAKALNISLPCLTPPSNITVNLSPTALTTSGKASIDAGT